ncbi:MAG: hypothetical protein D6739_11680, partial [Nitrospirae bacterium]
MPQGLEGCPAEGGRAPCTPFEGACAGRTQQDVLNGLLRLAVEPCPLEEQLRRALEEIVTLPWLPVNPAGAVFLTGEAPDRLELAVSHNLAPPLLERCRSVPFGRCLCGRAAERRTLQVATCVDERHEIDYPGMAPHGHYAVPMLEGERLVGVLTLYLREGHTPRPGEIPFIHAIAATLAKIVAHARTREALSRAKELAERANRAKTAFLGVMSHELRTPLHGILGMVDLLEETRLDEVQRDYLATARASARSLLSLLTDCLDLCAAEAEALEVQRRPFSPLETVGSAFDAVAAVAREKGVELVGLADAAVPARAEGDPARLRHVLVNLVGNAVKFTPAGGLAEVEVGFAPHASRPQLTFAVRDTGVGIDPELLPHLFSPFAKGDPSAGRRHGGTGLGLALCRQLVEAMGGSIGVESTPGEGATFFFRVPVTGAEPSA